MHIRLILIEIITLIFNNVVLLGRIFSLGRKENFYEEQIIIRNINVYLKLDWSSTKV
jgi:hypothetical protein